MRKNFIGSMFWQFMIPLVLSAIGLAIANLEFNPFELDAKKVEIDDEEDVITGLGIIMVKSKAKEFYYRRYQNFNTLAIVV